MISHTVPAFLADGGQMGARTREKNWHKTPLGAPETWPQPLKTLVGLMLVANQPMFIAWGREQLFLYNDPYIDVLADKHPWALGQPFLEVWSEIRADIEPLATKVFSGEPVHMEDISLVMLRRGLPEETHFAFSYTPVRGADGEVAGLFCACIETTLQVLTARRQAFRLELEEVLRTEGNTGAMLARAMTDLRRHLDVGSVGFGTMSESRDAMLVTTDEGEALSLPLDRIGGLLATKEAVVVGGTGEAVAGDAISNSLGSCAFVGAPVVRSGRARALLYVGSNTPRFWSPEDVELIGYVANRLWDTAERDAAETALRESEAHLAGIFAQTGTGFAETDLDGRFISVNDTYCALTGRSREELLCSDKVAITYPEDHEATREVLARVRDTGEPATIEKRYQHSDGRLVWVSNTVSPIRTAKGGRSLLTVAVDVSEQKQVEHDLAEAKKQAEEANQAKSTFIANMSHELRTPLSAIIGYSEMMAEEIADGCEPSDLAGDMAKVEGNARHLLGLINDVLDLSKVETGKMDVFAEDFAVEPMLRDVAATVDALVTKKGNTLQLDLAPELGDAYTDLVKLRQMLLNLFSNAAKFTENGTIVLRATREVGQNGDAWLRLTVRDSGIGMSPEELTKLFQRFTQADASTTRRFGGTGLGLSLTKALAEMLGGSVSVESAPDQGSGFTLHLPAAYATSEGSQAPEPPSDDEDPAWELVLVIDDDADQRALMTRVLHREKFRVEVAADGRSGLAQARRMRPRAILLDVMMPGIDGWSVLTELKSDPELSTIPVVMVTAVDQRSLAASLGATDYMLKPLDWNRFSEVVNRFRTPQGGILLVEDEFAIRSDICAVLEKDGWSVMEASDGREALEMVAAQCPAMVLLDLSMPVMDGFRFLEELRRTPGCAEVPVVVMTGRELSRDDRQRLRGASQILNMGDVSLQSLTERLHKLAETPST